MDKSPRSWTGLRNWRSKGQANSRGPNLRKMLGMCETKLLIWTLEYCIIVILEFSIKFFNLILFLLFLVILGFSDCFFFVIADKNSVSFKYFGPNRAWPYCCAELTLAQVCLFVGDSNSSVVGGKMCWGQVEMPKEKKTLHFERFLLSSFFLVRVWYLHFVLNFQYLEPWQLTHQ